MLLSSRKVLVFEDLRGPIFKSSSLSLKLDSLSLSSFLSLKPWQQHWQRMPILCHPFQRTVNTSSIAFYRLNQPSLTIFVLAVTVLSLVKNDPAMMTVTTSPACYFMISIDSQFDLNYRYYSAWLCVYHCSTERCVIRICINYLPSTQTNQTFVCRTWSRYTTTATKIKTIFLLISRIKISWFRTSAVFPRKWSQNQTSFFCWEWHKHRPNGSLCC